MRRLAAAGGCPSRLAGSGAGGTHARSYARVLRVAGIAVDDRTGGARGDRAAARRAIAADRDGGSGTGAGAGSARFAIPAGAAPAVAGARRSRRVVPLAVAARLERRLD